MSLTIDYYFAAHSPWSYLGHQRLWDLARQHDAKVNLLPVDLGGKVFPSTGGLPLAKRAPQRQAYRLVELKRYSEWLNAPMNLQPTYFPVNPDDANKLIIAVDMKDGNEAAMRLAMHTLSAVWVQQRNIADEATLTALLTEADLSAARIEDAHSQAVQERYEATTATAIDVGVFGAPSYVIDGEIYWGQDRLEFVERRLQQA